MSANEAAKEQDGKMNLEAGSNTNARVIGGSLAGGQAKYSGGITVTYIGDFDDVRTEIGDGSAITAAGDVVTKAAADSDVEVYNAAASIGTGQDASMSLGGAIDVILMDNLAENKIGNDVTVKSKGGKLDVESTASNDLSMFSFSLGAGKGTAAGGTVAYIND